MSIYHIKTKKTSYTVEDVKFIFNDIKITCTSILYYANIGSQLPTKIDIVSGFGYLCSEAFANMMDNIQVVINKHEKINASLTEDTFEKNGGDPREE